MKPEDKQLLLQDLCARLPYGVKAKANDITVVTINGIVKRQSLTGYFDYDVITDNSNFYLKEIKPYLRPMSSMTEEEQKEFVKFHCVNICPIVITEQLTISNEVEMFDWLNKKMFDCRGLIPKDLALSTEEFNPYKID